MMDTDTHTLALLIDADTTSSRIAPALFAEIAGYGTIGTRRVYTDWTLPTSDGWKDCLSRYAFEPMQRAIHLGRRTETDGEMFPDALGLLDSGRFSGFCLVSSDGNFARLAKRIRDRGVTVTGFGDRQTPSSVVATCDRFVFFDTLGSADTPRGDSGSLNGTVIAGRSVTAADKAREANGEETALADLEGGRCEFGDPIFGDIEIAVTAVADQDGRTSLADISAQLFRQMPNFDVRDYGYAALGDLVDDCIFLEVERRGETMQEVMVRIVPVVMDVPIPTNHPGLPEGQ
jgi:hypothetical protein